MTSLSLIATVALIHLLGAVKIGFLTNVLNPKVTLFFLGLFTIVISPKTPATTNANL